MKDCLLGIDSQVVIRANAFRMKVIAHDPYVDDEQFGKFRADNKGLISRDLLRSMKPDAYFINIARPHLAGLSPDVVKYHSRMIIDDISLLIRNKCPVNLYNPVFWEHSHFYQK